MSTIRARNLSLCQLIFSIIPHKEIVLDTQTVVAGFYLLFRDVVLFSTCFTTILCLWSMIFICFTMSMIFDKNYGSLQNYSSTFPSNNWENDKREEQKSLSFYSPSITFTFSVYNISTLTLESSFYYWNMMPMTKCFNIQ